MLERYSGFDKVLFEFVAIKKALLLASNLNLKTKLNLNLTPSSLIDLNETSLFIDYVISSKVPAEQIIIELTETAIIENKNILKNSLHSFKSAGIQIAIDDFGAGYSGLNLLVDYQPEIIKLDRHLVLGIQSSGPRQVVVRSVVTACNSLGIDIVAEGVETFAEYQWLHQTGIELYQGFLFAKPQFETFPRVFFPKI